MKSQVPILKMKCEVLGPNIEIEVPNYYCLILPEQYTNQNTKRDWKYRQLDNKIPIRHEKKIQTQQIDQQTDTTDRLVDRHDGQSSRQTRQVEQQTDTTGRVADRHDGQNSRQTRQIGKQTDTSDRQTDRHERQVGMLTFFKNGRFVKDNPSLNDRFSKRSFL